MIRLALQNRLAVIFALIVIIPTFFVFPAAASTAPTLITEPDQGMAPIYNLLGSPKKSLDLVMYEFRDPKAEQILANDAKRGVKVRVMLDKDFISTYNEETALWLQAHGVAVHWASHHVTITHQKTFVVDDKTAVIMSINFTSKYYSSTRDFAVVDSDPRDVSAVESTFNLDWNDEVGTAPNGSDLVWSPGSEAPLVALISSATSSIETESEEMKDPVIVAALVSAEKRGVRVEVAMTRDSSWYPSFDALTAAGVKVSTYSASASLYIHAKFIVIDNRRAFIGSENYSVGSLTHNRELGLITSASAVVKKLSAVFASDFAGGTIWSK